MARNATHESLNRDDPVRMGSDRSFGLVFSVVFVLISAAPLLGGGPVRWWALAVAVVILAVALLKASLLAPLNRLWFKFGMLLHAIVNPLIMGMIFFGLLTPTAFVMRVFRRDALRLHRQPNAPSYWIVRDPPGPPPDSMDRQF